MRLLNFDLMRHWQNWVKIALMIAIASVAFQALCNYVFPDDKN